MTGDLRYLACPQRPGNPRVALEVCHICPKTKRCQAWRDYRCPSLFPGLEAPRPRPASRHAKPPGAQPRQAAQASLAISG